MSIYRVVLFDLEGTLIDPALGIMHSVRYALSQFGIFEKNQSRLRNFIGPPLLNSFMKQYSFNRYEATKAIEYYQEYYSETGMFENSLYPGIIHLLKHLNENWKILILATIKSTSFSTKMLKHCGIYDYFNLVVGSDPDMGRLLKSEVIRDILLEIPHIPKRKIVMIGDSEHDISGAIKNSIDSIAVTYGYSTLEELQKVGPTYIINTISDLKRILTS